MNHRLLLSVLLLASIAANAASGAEIATYKLAIKDHRFVPSELTVPANTKFKLLVSNMDATPSEFESTEFNREKIVMPNSSATVFIGPLGKGRYKFFDDFHRDTGNGVLVVQ